MILQLSELADEESEPHNDCIGNLEHHVHKVFALVRVPGEDFVYSASIDLFNRLDDYCDEQGMIESRPPFLIKGESGTGKSALLSNWLQRRERTMSKSRSSNADSFIFWHAVGCSRQSMNINVVIKRLITELKTRFELTRPLPKQQDRYSWELPRFLDLAAKRGKVIIVIDGLNRLVNNDGTEDSLAWLPLEFPPNVRVILSVTIPPVVRMKQVGNAVKAMRAISNFQAFGAEMKSAQNAVNSSEQKSPFVVGSDRATSPGTGASRLGAMFKKSVATNSGDENNLAEPPNPFVKMGSFGGEAENKITSKKSRILAELDRRQIPFMLMTPLNKQLCRSLVEAFIHKSVNSESASLATGPYIASYLAKHGAHKNANVMMKSEAGHTRNSMILFGRQVSSAHQQAMESSEEVPGFLLFENQVTALLNHSQGGTPLFLRLFLRCLQYAVSRGYGLWAVYEDWMRARSVPELLIRILRTLENSFSRTRNSAQIALDKTMAAGGLPALKQLYSWHPAFQETNTRVSTAQSAQISMLQTSSLDSADGRGKMPAITPKQLRRMSTNVNATNNLAALYGEAAGDQIALATIAAQATETQNGAASTPDEVNKKLSNEVSQNLGDQAWYATEKDANSKLQRGLKITEESTILALTNIKQIAGEDGTDLLQALVKNIRAAHLTAMAASSYDDPASHRISHVYSLSQMKLRTRTSSVDSPDAYNDDESYADEDEGMSSDDESLVSIEERSVTSDHTVHSKTIKITQALIPPAMRVMGGSTPHPSTVHFHPETPGAGHHSAGFNTATGEAMAVAEPTTPGEKAAKSQYKALNNMIMGNPSPGTPSGAHGGAGFAGASTAGGSGSSNAGLGPVSDPSEGLNTLPVYLRGGLDTTGFGDILGNALALLYASRQGLRESELWKMLSLLQYKSERDTQLTQEMKAMNHAIVRKSSMLFLNSKGPLTDMFKSEDITRTGYISRKQIMSCVRRLDTDMRREDLIKMLEFADLHTPVAPANVTAANLVHYYQDRDLLIGDKVHYNKLFVVLGKLNKQLKFSEIAPGKTGALLATVSAKPTASFAGTASHSASTAPKSQVTGTKGPKKSHQAGDDDYENFNLAGIVGDQPAQSSIEEGGSHEASATFLTASMSALSDPDGGGSQAFKPFGASTQQGPQGGAFGANVGVSTKAVAPKLSIEIADLEEEEEEEANFSLGPVIEESLLCILSALGVLHDPENKVLILPSDSEPFRQVIYNNYILKRGGGTINYWHSLIIKHFQTEPNSMRKCEELPWHLKICRKWHALRDALVDLEAFDLMSRTDLKNELTEYWVLLTEGPLPFPEDGKPTGGDGGESGRPMSGNGRGPKPSARKAQDDDNESTYSHVLRDIDQAMGAGMSMKEARKKTFKDHVPPFDIVEELNKSMELWVLNDKPAPQKIHRMIIQIAKFLYEFSRSAHLSPDFLRLGIDLDSLNLFGSVLEPEMRGVEIGGKKNAHGAGDGATEEGKDDLNNTGNTSPMKQTAPPGAVNSPGQMAALKNKAAAEKDKDKDKDKAPGESEAKYMSDTSKHEAPKFPPPHMLTSNLYVYLRWVWIQFPWIALHSAPDVATMLKQIRKEEEEHRYDLDKKKTNKNNIAGGTGGMGGGTGAGADGAAGLTRAGSAPAGTAELSGHEGEGESLGSYANNSDSAMLLRVWNVKKSDPTIPVFVKSANRRLAAIKPRTSLTTSLERNVQVTYEKLYDEITSPSHIAKIRLGFKCKDKYRRPFEEEVDFNKNIPFAYHGVRAVKAGSLFPSYEKSIIESNKKRLQQLEEEAALNNGRHKRKKVKKFDIEQALQQQLHKDPKGAAGGSPFMLVELDDEIRRMNNEEYINKHKVESIGGAVVKDETDLELHACMDRISRMKTICNKLTVIYNEKVRLIHTLHRQVMHRHETDQQLIDEVVNSEVLLRHLNDRNVAMERDMAEAKKVEDGYLELLKVLKNNPPYIESHVKALEIEVQLAERQFQDLCEHRDKLYHETEKSDQYKREQQLERIEYFQHARYEVAIKKKQVLRQTRTLKGPNKRDQKANRRMTKALAGRQASGRVDSNDNTESSGSDSDNSGNEKKEIQLTAPVMHFLNAIVRKTTFNETIVKQSDQTLEDIKRRFDEDLLKANVPGTRRLNRMGSMDGDGFSAAVATDPAAATAAVAAEANPVPGDESSLAGSLNSRGNASNQGSLVSRDSQKAAPVSRRSSNLYTPEAMPAHERRSSGFGSGPGASYPMEPHYMLGGNGGHSQPASPGTVARRRLVPEQATQLREAIKAFLPMTNDTSDNGRLSGPKDPFKAQVQKAYELLLEKTASSSADEFIERFLEGQTLLSSLRKQQTLVDSRIAQLQSEHAELFATFSDLAFISDDTPIGSPAPVANADGGASAGGPAGVKASPQTPGAVEAPAAVDNTKSPVMSDRYLDNQLFAKEVRMNQLLRKQDRSEQIVSDVRTAVGYLINLMVINAKLLYALPKSDPPKINTNDDIMIGISWFEDRLIALSEALAMDANKPTGANTADDNKPLSERQLDLALLVQKMNLDITKPGSRQGGRSSKKQKGAMSFGLINADGDEGPFISPAGAVMVPPVGRVDKIFDSKMGKLIAEREKAADAQELLQKFSKDDENNATLVQNFLNEGLNLKETKDLARSANLLVNKRSGRVGSYGLVLENLITSKGQHFHPTNSSIRAHTKEASVSSPVAPQGSGVHNVSSVITGSSGMTAREHTATAHAHTPNHNNATTTAASTAHHSRSSSPVN